MKYDIILCGVGGQGVLSVAAAIATAAGIENLNVRQSEVHGMAQRGGAVLSHLRISDTEIHSDLVAEGSADMVLSMEPLESLRYISFLKPEGIVISAQEPFINIPNYPELDKIHTEIKKMKNSKLVDTAHIAKESQNPRASNMAIVGAASRYLPVKTESLKKAVAILFKNKSDEIINKNIRAIELGGSI
ncbi:MAG: indolepyruvate oxidoreductase subunit beta [Spirochaetes bacterium]|nr:indolepyruvate oxidoreductase subunit beta [Spirochaetota bacterium]MBN2770004.1 indolepyruvate oxidoreductase subunit beta [Spirochaetota bacterium]